MPLQIVPEVAPVASTIKITQIINDALGANLMLRYDEMDDAGNILANKTLQIKGIEEIRILYADIETEIRNGSTFEVASKKVLYAQIANGTLV